MKSLSIVITTKNEEKNLGNLLESIKKQDFNDYEVIVVDNYSTDKTKKIASEYEVLVLNKGPERSAQRNFGVSKSQGKYVLILDADMILEQGILQELFVKAESDSDLRCLTMKEEPVGESIWSRAKKLELEFYTQPEDFDLAPRWFDKQVFLEFGGFDENQTGTEDWDLPDRIYEKYPKKFLTSKRVFHNEGDYGLQHILRKKFYYASKSHKFVKKSKGGVFNPRFIYFLRPQFYRHWRLWFKDLKSSFSLVTLILLESFVGGIGFIAGKFLYNKTI